MLIPRLARLSARRLAAHPRRHLSSAGQVQGGQAGARLKWLAALSAASGLAWSFVSREQKHDAMVLAGGTARVGRTAVSVLRCVLDYKWTLWGLDPQSEAYADQLSSAHTRCAHRMLAVMQGAAGQGIYVKAGQHLCSLRPAIPDEYSEVLSVLHDEVAPRPLWEVQETLELALGPAWASLFQSLDPEPLGCASLAQVHRGQLHDGREVAIKVQHRQMDRMVEADLVVLKKAANFIAWVFPELGFEWLLPEIEASVRTELDFRRFGAWDRPDREQNEQFARWW